MNRLRIWMEITWALISHLYFIWWVAFVMTICAEATVFIYRCCWNTFRKIKNDNEVEDSFGSNDIESNMHKTAATPKSAVECSWFDGGFFAQLPNQYNSSNNRTNDTNNGATTAMDQRNCLCNWQRKCSFSASFWDAACIRTIKRFRSVWKVNFTGRRSLLIWYQIVCITVNVFERCQPVVCKWTLVIQYQIVRNTFNVFGTKGCQPAICKRSKMFVNFILI